MSRNLVRPNFPLPPMDYSQSYMQELVRQFSVYLQQMQNPGEARHTKVTLTNTQVGSRGLPAGQVFLNPNTGDLSIVGVGSATGGDEIRTYEENDANYISHTFLTSGTFEITSRTATVDVLIVGGGGSGGGNNEAGGGGGGGGFIVEEGLVVPRGSYTVTVGDGGDYAVVANGGDSSIFGLIAKGGGAGGRQVAETPNDGQDGGSGGGGAGRDTSDPNTSGGAALTYTQPYNLFVASPILLGNAGGGTTDGNGDSGSGGGGAGEAGYSVPLPGSVDATCGGGPGGDGLPNTFRDGTERYYAGGGGGGSNNANTRPAEFGGPGTVALGGLGGGGDGALQTTAATAGEANTGGGGGGSNTAAYPRGNGGSGIVIIRYRARD